MKQIVQILFLVYSGHVFCQSIYTPVFINPCLNNEVTLSFWHVTDSLNRSYYGNNEPLSLPHSGNYTLHYIPKEHSFYYDKTTGLSDTINLDRISFLYMVGTYSEYRDCGLPANGKITDLYFNGGKKLTGTFKDGQPIDTVIEYYPNGKPSFVLKPWKNNNWHRVEYFANGKIKADINHDTKVYKWYYENGTLKSSADYSKKFTPSEFHYHENGSLHKKWDDTQYKEYNKQGVLICEIFRKETLKAKRIFPIKKRKFTERFFDYEWNTFNDSGILIRQILFQDLETHGTPYCTNYHDISDYLFKEVYFYKSGKQVLKIKEEYIKENEKYVQKLIIYKKENNSWVKNEVHEPKMIYNLIQKYSAEF